MFKLLGILKVSFLTKEMTIAFNMCTNVCVYKSIFLLLQTSVSVITWNNK